MLQLNPHYTEACYNEDPVQKHEHNSNECYSQTINTRCC